MAVRDAELFTVAPDEVVVSFVTDPDVAVTTRVGEREVTTIGPFHFATITGLEPATTYALAVDGVEASTLLPAEVSTLPVPPGRLVATFATVNDVHFGEVECGKLGTPEEIGPVFTAGPGEQPYPEVMNRAAIAELDASGATAVLVKGDLTDRGSEEEYGAFLEAYGQLGDRLHHVRGNHDAMLSHEIAADAPLAIDLGGAVLAVLDTVRPGRENGRVDADQLTWLDELAAATTAPVFVFGHHHPWNPTAAERHDHYFGIRPDDSEALVALLGRRDNIVGYFAGHTHRNRVRRFPQARGIPIVEVACVKDYPGAWAEYRLHEGGYCQIVRRIGAPEAMAWTERTRHMFAGLYRDYALGSLAERCFVERY